MPVSTIRTHRGRGDVEPTVVVAAALSPQKKRPPLFCDGFSEESAAGKMESLAEACAGTEGGQVPRV